MSVDYVSIYDHRDNETRVPCGYLAREAAVAARENLGYEPEANEGLALDGVVLQPDAVLTPGERYELVLVGGIV